MPFSQVNLLFKHLQPEHVSLFSSWITLPKTYTAHEIDGWKMNFPFKILPFSGDMLVFGGGGGSFWVVSQLCQIWFISSRIGGSKCILKLFETTILLGGSSQTLFINHLRDLEGEQPQLGDLLTMVINHLLNGMILQVEYTPLKTKECPL